MVEVPGLQQVLANNDKKTKSPWFIPASFLVLYFLLAFSFYVVFRIIYYGVLFSQTIHYPPLATHLNLSSYHYYVTHFEGPVKFRSGLMIQFLYDLFGINRSLLRIIWSFFLSAITSTFLLGVFAKEEYDKCNIFKEFSNFFTKVKNCFKGFVTPQRVLILFLIFPLIFTFIFYILSFLAN